MRKHGTGADVIVSFVSYNLGMLRVWPGSMVLWIVACSSLPPPSDEDTSGSSTTDDGMPSPTATSTSTTGMSGMVTVTSTTAVDTTASTIGDPDSSEDGITFIMDPDGGFICHSCCDTWAQDCPDGEKCIAWANDGGDDWNGTRCSPIADRPGQPGDPCTVDGSPASGMDDCDFGAMCWNIDPDTLEGTCVALCVGDEVDPECDSPDDVCVVTNDGVLNLCLPGCDPLVDDCAAGQACVATASVFACVATTSGEGSAGGGPCEYIYDCDPGLSCQSSVDVGAPCDPGGCCTPYCDLSAPDPSAGCLDPAQICAPWDGTAPPPDESLGVCVLPGALALARPPSIAVLQDETIEGTGWPAPSYAAHGSARSRW